MNPVDLTKCQPGDLLKMRCGEIGVYVRCMTGQQNPHIVMGDLFDVHLSDAGMLFWKATYAYDAIAIIRPTRAELEEQRRELLDALAKIRDCDDAPIIDPSGDVEFGLHCGVEDRQCEDRYEGANYGYAQGSEKTREWACNIASSAIARVEATNG